MAEQKKHADDEALEAVLESSFVGGKSTEEVLCLANWSGHGVFVYDAGVVRWSAPGERKEETRRAEGALPRIWSPMPNGASALAPSTSCQSRRPARIMDGDCHPVSWLRG